MDFNDLPKKARRKDAPQDLNDLPQGERVADQEWFIAARRRLRTLGTALVVTAILCGVSNIVGLHVVARLLTQEMGEAQPPPNMKPQDREQWERGRDAAPLGNLFCAALVSLIYLPVLYGGWSLQRGVGRELGFAAAIMAMFPCSPGFVLGLPIGIWALVVLNNADVITVFNTPLGDRVPRRRRPREQEME